MKKLNKRQLQKLLPLFEEFIKTQGTDRDEWYVSDLRVSEHIINDFLEWAGVPDRIDLASKLDI